MKKGLQVTMVWLFLKVSLIVAITTISSSNSCFATETARNQEEFNCHNGNSQNLNERMSKLEAENRQQKQEIAVMKTTIHDNRKETENLNGRVSILEKSETRESQKSDDINVLSRPKRPYRLIPAKLPSSERKIIKENINTAPEEETFYGPPTCCEELQKLGYTLNGYYLIKGKEKLNANRIQVVYCQFHQPLGAIGPSFETVIGNVEIKTKSVHFYVQRKTRFPQAGILKFDVEQLNFGGAMSLTTGDFTAPVDGIYHFEFRCLKDAVPFESRYFLQVRGTHPLNVVATRLSNGGYALVGVTRMANLSYYLPGSITASLKLKASDVVNLYSTHRGHLMSGLAHDTQFVGWLVEEDLMLA